MKSKFYNQNNKYNICRVIRPEFFGGRGMISDYQSEIKTLILKSVCLKWEHRKKWGEIREFEVKLEILHC